jgi:hypothetical protein
MREEGSDIFVSAAICIRAYANVQLVCRILEAGSKSSSIVAEPLSESWIMRLYRIYAGPNRRSKALCCEGHNLIALHRTISQFIKSWNHLVRS